MKIIIFSTLVVFILFLLGGAIVTKRYAQEVPAHFGDVTKINNDKQKVLSFQITPDGKDVVYLAIENGNQKVYITNGTDQPRLLTLSDIKVRDPEDIKPGSAHSYVDTNGNIYFIFDLHLIEVRPDLSIKVYEYYTGDLIHSEDELNNKTQSKFFKSVADKYSKEPINVLNLYESPGIYTYLIDLNGSYCIESSTKPLELERLSLEGETVLTLQPSNGVSIRYGKRWDQQLQSVNDKAVIETITHTMTGGEIEHASARKYPSNLKHLLEDNIRYKVTNGKYSAVIENYCYPNFMPVDGPTCKGERVFATISGKKIMLPNYNTGEEKSDYDSSFIYVPYDRRYFTESGAFFFLAQHFDLYIFERGI